MGARPAKTVRALALRLSRETQAPVTYWLNVSFPEMTEWINTIQEAQQRRRGK
ncbi:hypothetical protein [Sporomusa acidovorans]|uniref:hypothetical protein n=1 Tax=Sporomusa acidovorans TaxID=112900 RepID=UPI0015A29F31|nr:hypothetical protein [Sporomusa acidovorans]